jgi:dTDP-4-dehydrorhamnose reductase
MPRAATVAALGMATASGNAFDAYGTYHLTAAGRASWYDFAERVLALDPQRDSQRVKRLRPTSSDEYPTAARRPRNGLLDTGKLARTLDIELPAWDEQLRGVMREPQSVR